MTDNKNSNTSNNRKRRHPEENNAAFLDTTSHILASDFTISRLPELESYYQSVVTVNETASTSLSLSNGNIKNNELLFTSAGGKCSNRHLRRRNGSYKPRRRHRFPDGNFEKKMIRKSSNESNEDITKDDDDDDDDVQRSRRWRRHPKRLVEMHNLWRRNILIGKEEEGVAHAHWLVSHYWHSKRFHMMRLFGWVIPMIHTNRGTKTALNASCTLQDASYSSQPFEILWNCDCCNGNGDSDGNGESLKEMLQCVMPGVSVSTERVWEGMMYQPNGYPALPVGPVRVLSFEEEGGMRLWVISHPLLYDTVHNILSSCIKEYDHISGPSVVHGGVGMLSLRGPQATSILTQTLSPSTHIIKQEKTVAHGYLITTSFTISNNPHNTISGLLIKSDNSNTSCSGWDIILPPSSLPNLPNIFLALNYNSAHAIGLVEQTRILTDANIPCFPRDYPDCPHGESYHDTKTITDSYKWKHIMDAEEWKWGKQCTDVIKKGNVSNSDNLQSHDNDIETSKSSIDWNLLIYSNDATSSTSLTTTKDNKAIIEKTSTMPKVIVLRGETYGAPFLQLFYYIGTPSDISSPQVNSKKRRRPRRPVSNPHKPILRPIPNKEQLLSQVQLMLASISSNVILRCIIHIENNGIIKVGDIIHEYNNSFKLGALLSAGYSLKKGKYSGTGFVNATLFLRAVRHALEENDNKSLVWIGSEGRRELRVWIKRHDCKPRLATLFLLM